MKKYDHSKKKKKKKKERKKKKKKKMNKKRKKKKNRKNTAAKTNSRTRQYLRRSLVRRAMMEHLGLDTMVSEYIALWLDISFPAVNMDTLIHRLQRNMPSVNIKGRCLLLDLLRNSLFSYGLMKKLLLLFPKPSPRNLVTHNPTLLKVVDI